MNISACASQSESDLLSTPEGHIDGGSAGGFVGPKAHRRQQVAKHLIVHVGLRLRGHIT